MEGETAMIVCNVTGYPMPEITWWRQLEDTSEYLPYFSRHFSIIRSDVTPALFNPVL